jgi:superfamily I DNA/RNA helicase
VAATRAEERLFLMQAPFTKANRRSSATFDEPSPFVAAVKASVLRVVRA